MAEQKISPELQVAMRVSEEEREKSLDLDVGYSELFEEWELIVKYVGDLNGIRQELGIGIEELLGGYAIVRISQRLIDRLSNYPQIQYIEKPKNLLIEQMEGIEKSCVARIRQSDYDLTGKGCLVACLDSGVDIYHRDFRNADGTTRLLTLWDQTIPGNPPSGFYTGSVYNEDTINRALALENDLDARRAVVGQFDSTGHGTAVLGIMAGNGGMAPEASIIAVKLGNPSDTGYPRTTQLMLAMDYAIRFAMERNQPLAINISYGNNYGAHNGDSILEQYIDTISRLYRVSIAAGTGNEGVSSRHAAGVLKAGVDQIIEISVAEYVQAFNLQIWKNYADRFELLIETPEGKRIGPIQSFSQVQSINAGEERVVVYFGEPTPVNPQQEIYISWIPNNQYISEGIWRVSLIPRQIVSGAYNMWLPVSGSTTAQVSFVTPSLYNTLVVPASARGVISVSAYDSRNDTFAAFSGRGAMSNVIPFGSLFDIKPDIAAPGVAINTCEVGGGYGVYSGTSFATPFVTGAAALLMQWGIVNGNDPYLYGEKVRANLIRGARKLPFQERIPSPLVGWGALCVSDSIIN